VANQVAQLNCGGSPVPYPCSASTALSSLSFSAASSAELCQIVQINGSSCTGNNGTLSNAALSASLNVLQVLSTEAELANGGSGVNVGTLGGITGITSGTLYFSGVQPTQFADGEVGTSVTTQQIGADLQLNILGGLLDIPISTSASAATATATLSAIRCQNNALKKATITVTGTGVTNNVTLAGAPIGQLTIGAVSGSPSFTTVPPTSTTISNGSNPVTTSATLSYSGTQSTTILAVFAVLQPILQALGVNVGNVQTADLSVNCGAVTLVQ